jgi:excisionase family DNA binding protein
MDATEREKVVSEGSVTVPEGSRFTGIGRTFLYGLMARGELRYVKVGKRRLIPRSELVRLLADRLVGE